MAERRRGQRRALRSRHLWGSIGAWFSGRWHDPGAESYVVAVKDYMARRVWRTRDFAGG